MKIPLMLVFCTLSCMGADIKIIVSGQSNAVGYALGVAVPDPRVLAYDPATNSFAQAADPLPFWENRPDVPGYGTRSPWINLGKALIKQYDHVYITGAGHGAESITYWDDAASSPSGVDQPGWIALKANILASGIDANYFIFYQGETDAENPPLPNWDVKFANLAARVRALVSNPNLPILVIQLADTVRADFPNFPLIKAAQYSYTVNDDHAFLIQTLGFPLMASPDNLHLVADGQDMLARACAKQILGATWFMGPQGPAGPQGPKGDDGSQGMPAEIPTGMVFLYPGDQIPPNAILLKHNAVRLARQRFAFWQEH